jgi:hypothetical protein
MRVLDPEECPANTIGAVLALRGRRLEDENWTEAKSGDLVQLFHALLGAVDRGLSIEMYPDFNPSLSWLAADDGTVCTLLPAAGCGSRKIQSD